MATNLTENTRKQWEIIGNETNKRANTARRVGDAGSALVDLIEDVRSEIPEFSATLTVFTTDGESYDFGLHELTQSPQPYYSAFGMMIGEIL